MFCRVLIGRRRFSPFLVGLNRIVSSAARLELFNTIYNIASRAKQSNSVYIRVLKISIVHADGVSKSLRQIFFSRERPLLARCKILYFAAIMDTNRDSAHQFQKEDNFATISQGLEFLNEAEKEKNNGKGLGISAVTIRFTVLR